MDKKIFALFASLLIVVLLAGCQAANGATPSGVNGGPGGRMGTPSADMMTQMASGNFPGPRGQTEATATAIATATAAPTATPEPTATTVSETALAEKVAQDYYTAIEANDFSGAADLVSSFSLRTNHLSADDVIASLTDEQASGVTYSGFKIADSQVFDDQTILVHVTYTKSSVDSKTKETVKTAVDEQWPFRLESKKWKYNWTNIIDFKTLSSTAKLSNGLTIKPQQITRYSDKIRLNVLAQNSTGGTIVIGNNYLLLGTFHFGDETITAEQTLYIFEAMRSYTNVNIDVKGLFTTYPDAVELVKSKTSTAAAWYTFGLEE